MSQLALARPLLQIKEKEKEKKNNIQNQKKRKRKEILNNDLAVLPSHDIQMAKSTHNQEQNAITPDVRGTLGEAPSHTAI